MPDADLLRMVRGFIDAMTGSYDLEEVLQLLTEQAVAILGAHGAGILLEDRSGELEFATATNDAVREAERRQAHRHTGACYEAFEQGAVVVANTHAQMERWPQYADWMRELGLHAVIGVPLTVNDRPIGALNVYREVPTEWSESDVEVAEAIGAMSVAYILNAAQIRDHRELVDQLQEALDSRGIIERAKGMLMERESMGAEEAFETLRSVSQATNRKLREIAEEVVERFSSELDR